LEKVLAKLPELVEVAQSETTVAENSERGITKRNNSRLGTLAAFLKEKNTTSNQVKKFLATSVYLHDTTGKNRLTTTEVKNALKNANQPKLNNPSDCLNSNVTKGHCEKDGDNGFFVTDPGRASLGM